MMAFDLVTAEFDCGVFSQFRARAKFQARKTCALASHNDGYTWNLDEPIRAQCLRVSAVRCENML